MSEEIKRNLIKKLVDMANHLNSKGYDVYDSRFIENTDVLEENTKDLICALHFKKKEDYIECPLEFATYCGNLGLKFGKNQSLLYHKYINCWIVSTFDNIIKTKICKTPTPQDKLEVGKWYYCTDMNIDDNRNHKPIEQFHLYLGENEYVWVDGDGKSLIICEAHYKHWHEVVEDEY